MSKKSKTTKEKGQKNEISKEEQAIKTYCENVGKWVCAYCATGQSSQPAKVIQNLRGMGYQFEETSPGVYAKQLYCEKCGVIHTHYKLKEKEPKFNTNSRFPISQEDGLRVKKILKNIEAFTCKKTTTQVEIYHKTPIARSHDIQISKLSDDEIKKYFQLLSSYHNSVKQNECAKCIKTIKRPPFMGNKFWQEGDENYQGTCVGCGYYDGVKWTDEYNNYTEHQKAVDNAKSNLINYLYQSLESPILDNNN